jgi:antitoxin (DNA-binding transcriptional repressor) of toxin-antitoxin stability system
MRVVGIRVLKNKLSEYVRLAAGGETVLVTDRDRVVAEIGPPRAERSAMAADATLAEIVRKGWLSPPTLGGNEKPPRLPVGRWSEIAGELERDREDR